MPVTYLETDTIYKRILHASDLHIRTGDPQRARYTEYSIVFKQFIELLNGMDISQTLTVITGDLFHHKGKIEPAGIQLTHELFSSLLDKTPVVVICGNHDYRQDDPDIPDMIETLLGTYHKRYPLYYLNKTGHYVIGNLGFGVVDVRDTLKCYNTYGRYDDLPEFPSVHDFPSTVEYTMALFHGTVAPKEVYERYTSFQGYPLEWIKGYSKILLGDIHRQQIHVTPDQTWAYPGSLIQQDFGESWKNHGFLEWDLLKNRVHVHHVYNPFGMCTLKHTNEWLVHVHKKEWQSIQEASQDSFFPKTPMIRLLNSTLNECKSFLMSYDIEPTCIQTWFVEDQTLTPIKGEVQSHSLEELNTPDKWMDYLKTLTSKDYSNFILHPETLKIPDVYESFRKYTERNEKIQKWIDDYQRYRVEHVQQTHRVELVHLSWSYLMCYGESNHFDFKQLSNKIALLNGKNAMGKSSFLDVLCIALYGEATKMRHLVSGKKYTDKIIHDQRPAHKMAPYVKLMVQVQGICYEIHRVFGVQSAKHKEHSIMTKEVVISKIEGNQKNIVAEGNTMVDRWIQTYIGSMESVLMSTMICQMDLNNFFHLKQDDQKHILDSALRLENVSLYGKIVKESLLAHLDIQSQIKEKWNGLPMVDLEECKKQWKQSETTYETIHQQYNKVIQQKDYWLTKIRCSNWKEVDVPESIEVDYQAAKDDYAFYVKNPLDLNIEESIRMEERRRWIDQQLESYKEVRIYKDSEKHLEKWLNKQKTFMALKPNLEVSMEWILEKKQGYQEWWKDVSYPSMEELNREKETWLQSMVLKPTTPKIEGDIESIVFQKEPTRTMEEYNEWKQQYEQWMNVNSSFQDWTSKTYANTKKEWEWIQERLQTQKEYIECLNQLEALQEYTFNPECAACQSNPIRRRKQQLEEHKKHLEVMLQKRKVFFKKHSCLEDSAKKLYNALEAYKQYAFEKEFYQKESQKWEEIYQSIVSYEEYLRQKSIYDWKRYDDWQMNYQAFLKNYETVEQYWKEKTEWECVMKRVEEQEKNYELLAIWKEEESIVVQKIQQFQKSIEKQRFQSEYDSLVPLTSIEEWKHQKQIQDRMNEQESLYAIYKVKECMKTLEELKCQLDEAYQAKLMYEQLYHQMELQESQRVQYQTWMDHMSQRIQSIQELEIYFMGDKHQTDGYKEWIYKHKVIPMLNKEMNIFLGLFEAFRFKMVYDKKQFIYLLEDRGNEPTLDKASGYQNFIISLAFRLALTRIGAIGQQLKHLFIDEGFTACDSSNIEKVPLLLNSILTYGNYHSILLMSHLDSVRECTHTMIHIQREDPFSYIRFGEGYPTFVEYKKMKKKEKSS